jgi:uncharacterized delta-60 repeat protein
MKLTFTLIALFSFSLLNAQKAGTQDSSFGIDGKVITSSTRGYLDCIGGGLQSDGSIIAAGGVSSIYTGTDDYFAIKYSPDGKPDSSFGRKGIADLKGLGEAETIAIQKDNKIIVGGYSSDLFGTYYIITAGRFNADGSIDTSFGKHGSIQTDLGQGCGGIAIQSDGKILFVGRNNARVVTIRYLPDGILDKSFGNNGSVESSFGSSAYAGTAIAVQQDGKIIIAGYGGGAIVLARYNSDGSYDTGFGNNGKVISDITNGSEGVNDIVLQPDGKIVAVGTTYSIFGDTSRTIVLRYMQDGSLDKSFGTNGFNIYKLQTNAQFRSVTLQKDGKIIAAGIADDSTEVNGHFLAERYNTDGTIDSGFGSNGYQVTAMDQVDVAENVMLQQDGKIVLVGAAYDNSKSDPSQYEIALARYYNNDLTKKQIIVQKIRHYIQTHNAQATTLSAVSIYPNPAQNVLHVEDLSTSPIKLTVVDFRGSIVVSRELSAVSGVYDLNIASLHAGNYLLKIEMNGEVVTKQFVKE